MTRQSRTAEHIDMLMAEVKRLTERAERAEALNAEWAKKAETWLASPEAAQRLEGYRELASRLERAEAALANPLLTGMNIGNGTFDIGLEGAGPQLIAGMFLGMFEKYPDAKNYIEVTFDSPQGPLLVTVVKPGGKTPHQARREAEAERDALKANQDAFLIEARQNWLAEFKMLEQERDALRADAERYRWLLSYITIDPDGETFCSLFPLYLDPPSVSAKTDAEQVNAAIDAAMTKESSND